MKTPAPTSHSKRGLGIGQGHTLYPRAPQLKCVVTEEMIRTAKIRDSSHCMTVQAIEAAFPAAFKTSVDLQTCRFSDKSRRLRFVYLTPKILQKAIVLWDQGRSIEPFSFTLVGAHVVAMHENKKWVTGVKTTPDGQQPIAVPVKREISRKKQLAIQKANLARQGLVLDHSVSKGSVPLRIGGKAPPIARDEDDIPFSKRRAFGLRALVR